MGYLSKEELLFERDENGELLPVDLPLKMLEKKDEKGKIIKPAPIIKYIPIPRGKWIKMILTKNREEQDKMILTEHVLEPKITIEEYEKAARPMLMTAMVTAITAHTLDQEEEDIKEQDQKN